MDMAAQDVDYQCPHRTYVSDVWILRLPQRRVTHCARYLNTLSLKTERRDPQLPRALGKQDLRWSLLHWERELRLTVGFITHDKTIRLPTWSNA
jgi:hypothetical protein